MVLDSLKFFLHLLLQPSDPPRAVVVEACGEAFAFLPDRHDAPTLKDVPARGADPSREVEGVGGTHRAAVVLGVFVQVGEVHLVEPRRVGRP